MRRSKTRIRTTSGSGSGNGSSGRSRSVSKIKSGEGDRGGGRGGEEDNKVSYASNGIPFSQSETEALFTSRLGLLKHSKSLRVSKISCCPLAASHRSRCGFAEGASANLLSIVPLFLSPRF